ncbi:MAG: diaminopimelate epimerase [Bacillota bacterium]
MEFKFTKMHGLGNDFLVIDNSKEKVEFNDKEKIKYICKRRFGVGADGILEILSISNPDYDFEIKIHNSDGSEAEMCGNGIRCVAHYIKEYNLSDKNKLNLKTKAGKIIPKIINYNRNNKTSVIKVNLGKPKFKKRNLAINLSEIEENQHILNHKIIINDKEFNLNMVSMGNPHAVIFINEKIDELNWKDIGSKIENHPLFPEKTNVEFARILGENKIKLNVWERGAGATLACGTGAAATVVAASLNNLVNNKALVKLPGGDLEVSWNDNGVFIEGESKLVFDGKIKV